jgi:hypothetical protein
MRIGELATSPCSIRLGLLLGASTLVLGAGCAHRTLTKVRAGDSTTEGARYWMPAPYLLVTAPVVLSREETVVSFNPNRRELAEVTLAAPRPSAAGRPPVPKNDGDFELKAVALAQAPRGRPRNVAAKGRDKTSPPVEANGPELPAPVIEATGLEGPAGAISVVWLPDYCEGYAASQRGLIGSAPLNIALADGWKLASTDAPSKPGEAAGPTPAFPLPVPSAPAEPDARKLAPRARKTEAAEPGAERFFRRVTTVAVKPGLYRVFDRASCDKEPTLSTDILKPSLQSVRYEELK